MRFAASKGIDLNQFMDGIDTTSMSSMGINAREHERTAGHEAEGIVAGAGIGAMAKVGAAKYGAAATEAEGRYAGQSSMVNGLMSGITSGVSAGLKVPGNDPTPSPGFSYNKTKFGAGGGTVGGIGTLGPNYGIPQV